MKFYMYHIKNILRLIINWIIILIAFSIPTIIIWVATIIFGWCLFLFTLIDDCSDNIKNKLFKGYHFISFKDIGNIYSDFLGRIFN